MWRGRDGARDGAAVEAAGYGNLEADGVALAMAAEPVVAMMNKVELEKLIKTTEKQMEAAAKDLDFLTAAKLRDELAADGTPLTGCRILELLTWATIEPCYAAWLRSFA